jgi:hypothetical protein
MLVGKGCCGTPTERRSMCNNHPAGGQEANFVDEFGQPGKN